MHSGVPHGKSLSKNVNLVSITESELVKMDLLSEHFAFKIVVIHCASNLHL